MNDGQAISDALMAAPNAMGMSHRDIERATGIARDTFRRWIDQSRRPTPRMVGIWLDGMAKAVRRRSPELDYLLDPLRVYLGQPAATEADLSSIRTTASVPAPEDSTSRYAVRMADGRIAVCATRDLVPGHLHAARWRSATGAAAGIYRVTPVGKTQVALTQDDRPGDVLLVKTDQLDRCDPVIALVQHLLPETQG